MKQKKTSNDLISYLDVSQYIIKEHSPLLKPSPPQLFYPTDSFTQNYTPDIRPIDHDASQILLTPITSGLIRQEIQDLMDDFMLQGSQIDGASSEVTKKKRKNKRITSNESIGLNIFKFQNQLDRILQVDGQYFYSSDSSDQSSDQSSNSEQQDNCIINMNTMRTAWSMNTKTKDLEQKDASVQFNTEIENTGTDYNQMIKTYSKSPKNQLVKKVKEIFKSQALISDKLQLVKAQIQKYIVQFQIQVFEQSWKQLSLTNKDILSIIVKGIQQTFNKKIGSLSFQVRRIKLLKYLQKKKRRIWRKKVSYDCRKKVADGRLRIKGKFVTREQACEQLGLQNLQNFTAEQIKQMLEQKMFHHNEVLC